MSVEQMQAVLDQVTYKPGWKFTVYQGEWEGPHVVITTQVIDAYDPTQSTVLDVHSSLPPMRDEDQLMEWLAWRLGRIEVHEMREFLKFDGQPVFDPHAPLAERDNREYQP